MKSPLGVPGFQGSVPGLYQSRCGICTFGKYPLCLDWDRIDATFYSDSMNDVPLLERVDHPVATNPDARLRALAGQRGWRILDLFQQQA